MRKRIFALLSAFTMLLGSVFSAACSSKQNGEPSSSTSEEEESKVVSANEYVDERMMLGMYHITPVLDDVKNHIKFEDAVEGDIFNVFLLSRIEIPNEEEFDYYCNKIYEAGKRFFIFDSTYLWNSAAGWTLYKDIYVRMNDLKENLRSKNYYDAFLGWYVDEPLLIGITLNDLREASRAFRVTFPDKRFMTVFSAGGMSSEYSMPAGKDRLTREGGEFITDIGFDIYGAFGDYYHDLWQEMTDMFEGMDKNYWAVPMTMNYASKVSEQDAIGSIEGCWDVVKSTEGGVGMMMYNAYTYAADVENIGNIGFCDMAYTTKEEFMTWKDKKNPWKNYYYKYYNEDGSQVTAGVDFEPWTNLADKIEALGAEVNAYNEGKLQQAESEIVCADGQTFVYDGGAHSPVVSEWLPNLSYSYLKEGESEWTTSAPSAVGSYSAKITLPESIYRKAAEKVVTFTISEAKDTMIAPEKIVEDYSSAQKTVKFDMDGLTISTNGIDYTPYVKNTPVDVTDMITSEGSAKYIWLKEGDKAPYGYRVKQYQAITIQDFEKGSAPAWSAYQPTGIIKHDGSYAGQLKFKYNADGLVYTSENYFSDFVYPLNSSNLYSLAGCTKIEFWIYTDKAMNVGLWLIGDTWSGVTTSEQFAVEKNTWTKLSFDLSKYQPSSSAEYVIEHMHMITILLDQEPGNVFVDSISAVGLK